jgi:hypothetical protein
LTITPVSAVLAVQPTPLPWSARQAQMSSRMTLALFTTRLVAALPGVAPPMRKNTSLSVVGSVASLFFAFFGPTSSSDGELVGPASNSSPATFTPGTSPSDIVVLPPVGTRVAKPSPSTTVSARFTLSVWLSWYTPGVNSRFRPSASASLITSAVSVGLATKKSSMEIDVPGVGPLPQVVPEESCCTDGTKTR